MERGLIKKRKEFAPDQIDPEKRETEAEDYERSAVKNSGTSGSSRVGFDLVRFQVGN